MDKRYHIMRMNQSEIALAIEWAKQEGWNPGLNDADCFYSADPNGFFIGKIDNQVIAMGSAINYDDQFSFCGFYIVHPAYRNQGYGLALTKERLHYVGVRNAGIDGVIPMLDKYARLGYQFAHQNARYAGKHLFPHPLRLNPKIVPLSQIPFLDISQYDQIHFPARREAFLKAWIHQPGALSLGYLDSGKLLGYGVIRPCYEGFKIGPLFADEFPIAQSLFQQLAHHAGNQSIYIDIPECNLAAIELVTSHHLKKVFSTARMYLKEAPKIALEHIYGITSFELG